MEKEDGETKNEYTNLDEKNGLPAEATLVGWVGVWFFLALIIFILYELMK